MQRNFRRLAGVILVLAVVIRLLAWPGLHEVRDGDEITYAWGSLQLLEGNLPGIHYAPAGPQTIIGFLWEGAISCLHLIAPDKIDREQPSQLRPFAAIEHTLFDAYRDGSLLRQVWIATSVIASIAGIWAALKLGFHKAGPAGGLFLGGMMAFLPLFVEFSVEARPYIVAWSLGVVGLYFALASRSRRSLEAAALALALAAASRIEAVMLLPIVWSSIYHGERNRGLARSLFKFHLIVVLTFLVAAPWYAITLVAGLRAILTIRGAPGLQVASEETVLEQLAWTQGILLPLLLGVLGIIILITRSPRRLLVGLYAAVLAFSMLKGAAFGLRYQGVPLLVLFAIALEGLAFLQSRSSAISATVAILSIILPAVQSVKWIHETRMDSVQDQSVQWIEENISPRSVVYVRHWLTNLLPTPESADAGWAEVTNDDAYKKKFQSGLARLGLPMDQIPRALSEVNLALERANRRFLFILGGRHSAEEPRFDIKVYEDGPVFGIRDIVPVFKEKGGVLVVRGPKDDPLVAELGTPVKSWLNRREEGARIYCSPDVVRNAGKQ
jgi:hypothetical protein